MKWEEKLLNNVTTIDELSKHIPLTATHMRQMQGVINIHPMSIPRHYLSLIDKDNPKDPLRKLLVPSPAELNPAGSYDPCGESAVTKTVGLQHKYQQTAVILSTNRCAAYCRFCFRKRLVGIPNREILDRFGQAAEYIQEHSEINNVLITGGDPLALPTHVIAEFLRALAKIDHLDFIRFGSRVPVTFPDRILDDESLTELLHKYCKRKRIYVVTHFNHPREITPESAEAINRLRQADITVSNQTVLLKEVNEHPDVLAELFNGLVRIGVIPYYLFQCRPVKRVKDHFQVPLMRGYRIIEETKRRLDGHSKRFRYCMSHALGKIEMVGLEKNIAYFRFHQAKYTRDLGRYFHADVDRRTTWLENHF